MGVGGLGLADSTIPLLYGMDLSHTGITTRSQHGGLAQYPRDPPRADVGTGIAFSARYRTGIAINHIPETRILWTPPVPVDPYLLPRGAACHAG